MFLVDSSVWIDHFRGRSTTQSDWLLNRIDEVDRFYTGDLILAEVLQGCDKDWEFEFVHRQLTSYPVLTVSDREIAIEAARNYRRLRALGITVRKTIDTLIATRCIVDGIPLLYSDRDFDPFVAHLGLAVP